MSDGYEKVLEDFHLTENVMLRLALLSPNLVALPKDRKVTINTSPIHGLGMFATQTIEAMEWIAPALIGGLLTPAGLCVNHSNQPNAQYNLDENWDIYQVALRDIAESEEVTNDYRRNARVSYASVVRCPLEQVTDEALKDIMLRARDKVLLLPKVH